MWIWPPFFLLCPFNNCFINQSSWLIRLSPDQHVWHVILLLNFERFTCLIVRTSRWLVLVAVHHYYLTRQSLALQMIAPPVVQHHHLVVQGLTLPAHKSNKAPKLPAYSLSCKMLVWTFKTSSHCVPWGRLRRFASGPAVNSIILLMECSTHPLIYGWFGYQELPRYIYM